MTTEKENDALVISIKELSDQISQLGQLVLSLKKALPGEVEMKNLIEALYKIAEK